MARSEKNLTAVFTDTANAIRSKTGTTETICPLDFADKINAIETGGGTGGNDRLHDFVAAGGGFGGTHLPSDDNDINKYIYPEDYERLTSCSYKFSNSNIKYLPNLDYTKIKYISSMFENDKNLVFRTSDKNGNVLPIFTMQLNGVIDVNRMFAGCTSLGFVNLSIVSGCANNGAGRYMFNGAYLKDVDLRLKDCPYALQGMFSYVKTITKGDDPDRDDNYGNFDSFNIVWDYTPGYIYTVSFDEMFAYCDDLRDAPYFTIPKFNGGCSFQRMFNWCENLRTIPAYDLSTVYDGREGLRSFVDGCHNLEEFHATGIKCDLDLTPSTRFTREALLEVLNNLATVTSTMTLELGSTNLAKLTDEDKAIATNKGWTLA